MYVLLLWVEGLAVEGVMPHYAKRLFTGQPN